MSKTVILTGLRANTDLHLGNYLGALLPMVDMSNSRAGDYQINLFVPDLHSFTTPIDHTQLHKQTIQNIAMYVAAGLQINHSDVYVYRQSFIPAHSELTWILDCFTYFGEMRRMTQFKEKTTKLVDRGEANLALNHAKSEEDISRSVSVGLFNYPVLMAADILLYGASYVPVGEDQTQHLEFARDIAQRINKQFGDIFMVPASVAKQHEFFGKDQGLRIRDLADPVKKMSKSDESGKGVLFLSDAQEITRQKIMSATTDSFNKVVFDMDKQPGVSNLLHILALLNKKPLQETVKAYSGQTTYKQLKSDVADAVTELLAGLQTSLKTVDETILIKKLETDESAMNIIANKTLLKVQKAVGLRL